MPGLKVLPDKICETCGKPFNRRVMGNGRLQDVKLFLAQKHCSRTCGNSRKELKPRSYLWRARKHRKDACEACGYSKRLTVHHCDQDQTNNDPSNLQTLCSHCHDFWHATAKRVGRVVAGKMPSLAQSMVCHTEHIESRQSGTDKSPRPLLQHGAS